MNSKRVSVMVCVLLVTLGEGGLCVAADECRSGKPQRIAGALCGTTRDTVEASVPDVELRIADTSGAIVATCHADAKGAFKCPPLPKGNYRVTVLRWNIL